MSGLVLLSVEALAATSPPLQPTVSVSAVATDNSGLTSDALKRSDLVGDIDTGVLVQSRGARLVVSGDAGLEFIGYARGTAPNRVLPRGHLDLNAILVERALFFDGSLSAVRTRSDPLAAQSDSASTANTVSTVSLRASPYFAHEFSPTLSATARSDTIIARSHSDGSDTSAPNGSTYQHDVVSIVRKPAPIGMSIDALHEDTRYEDDSASVLRTDSLQATLSAALANDFVVGLLGGHEHAVYSNAAHNDTTYGAMLQWHPSRRTALDVDAEHHYFGTGFKLHFRDRLPRSTVDLSLTRSASASPSTFALSGPDANPGVLLAALLSSRTPPPAQDEGDHTADNAAQGRGLPSGFAQPFQITSESAQLATRATLNLIFDGLRDTFYASVFYQKAVALPGSPESPLATTFDSRQWGGSLGMHHRLMPTVSAAAEIEWSSIDALGARSGDSSHQIAGTLSLTQRLGPRTSLSCGLRHFNARIVLDSTSTTTTVRENQAFAGLRVQY